MLTLSQNDEEETKNSIKTRNHYPEKFNDLSYADILIIESLTMKKSGKWSTWSNEIISYSKDKKSTVLIVEKYIKKCHVYTSGEEVACFNTEFGAGWLKEKNYKGDNATPEGLYYITSKKEFRDQIIYKELFLNFPNEQDRSRLNHNFKHKKITSLNAFNEKVRIHGGGNKHCNWTDGSIALDDSDMSMLFGLVKIGTRVAITGLFNKDLILAILDKNRNGY